MGGNREPLILSLSKGERRLGLTPGTAPVGSACARQPRARPRRVVEAVIFVECLLSGFLGLYVGLDYLARTPILPRWNGGYEVIRALLGQGWPTELLQDYAGARAILFGGNAYEPAGVEAARYADFGWMALPETVSTHPPGAFALLLPLAPFSFGIASAIWAVLMLAGLIVAIRLFGAPWHIAALLGPLSLLAPPVAAAVNHLAVPWLVMPCLAFVVRRKPALAGLLVGLVSLTKFLPGVLIAPFTLRRQGKALITFALVWAASLATVAVLNPDVLRTYIEVARSAAGVWLAEPSNASFLIAPSRFGPLAEALAIALAVMILWQEVRDVRARQIDEHLQWARWNWIGVALLPITWTYSVLPLAFSLVLLFQRRRLQSLILGLVGFGPVLFTFDTSSPFPAFFCTMCVGCSLLAAGSRWSWSWRTATWRPTIA